MSIHKDISELVRAEIISQETAGKIRDYYQQKSGQSQNRLLIVFGILGAILTGLGIILIIAHNWDELSRATKTIFAFIPLIGGQVICGYTLLKKPESVSWRESGSAFLFFAVGGSISLVSQIYNIPGNLDSFLLTWVLLCLPLIYVMRSSIASLLCLVGITWYATETGYWSYPSTESYLYWILLMAVLPHYSMLLWKRTESNFTVFHNWLVPLSVIIALGTVAKNTEELMFAGYISLFGLFYLIGNTGFFKGQKTANNAYLILGSMGTISLLLALSFDWFWEELIKQKFQFSEVMTSPEMIATVVISLLAFVLFFIQQKRKSLADIKPIEPVFILFIITFILGLVFPAAAVLVNLLVFAIAILTIREGAKLSHLGILNYGLLIITALVICRFFDTDLSFVLRGLLFVSVGIGFFVVNFRMLKKRKLNE